MSRNTLDILAMRLRQLNGGRHLNDYSACKLPREIRSYPKCPFPSYFSRPCNFRWLSAIHEVANKLCMFGLFSLRIFAAKIRKVKTIFSFLRWSAIVIQSPIKTGAGIRGYQRFASTTEISCVERIIICLTDPPPSALDIFLWPENISTKWLNSGKF